MEKDKDDNLSSAIAKFSAKFFKEVDAQESAVSSPLSAELVLALLALGATGRSRHEILQALHLLNDVDFVRTGFGEIVAKLTKVKGITFNMANKVYLKEGLYELNSSFKDDAVNVFGADVEKINFDNGAAAADAINEWVEGKTNNRIKDLLSEGSFDTATRLIFINALYFKGSWKYPFDSELTTEQPFHVNSKQIINIPFMEITKKFNYGMSEELDAKLLEIPYVGEESSLLVVLPNQVEGLRPLLDALAAGADLVAARNNMYLTIAMLSLPKFKIETTIDLKVILPKLGINTIFDEHNKDLSGLLEDEDPEPLFVSQAVQKVFIEVNEEGTKVIAATAGMGRVPRSMPPQFLADRPFYFALLAGPTVLFTGHFIPSN